MKVSRIDVSAENDITVIAGMSRSGKSAYAKLLMRDSKTIMAWDPDGEYIDAGITRGVYNRAALKEIASSAAPGRWSYVAPIDRDEFNFWSLCTLHKGNYTALTAVAEETADVTSSGKAPHHWGQLVRKGGKRHIKIIAITQTPQESDKTVLRNARYIACFMLDGTEEIEYMARKMRVPFGELAALQKLQALVLDKHAPGGRTVTPFQHKFRRRA